MLPGAVRPDPAEYAPARLVAWDSTTMELFREALRSPGRSDVRTAVLDDLSSGYGYSPEECVERCIHWEAHNLEEYVRRERTSSEGLADFYDTTTSWSFDLLWYAYLQAEGYEYPTSVVVALDAMSRTSGRDHLDFGSGVGVTNQLFHRLGFRSTGADVSTSLLRFARHRLDRRPEDAGIDLVDLDSATLEPRSYDVVTAIDTLTHVPDLAPTLERLHGWLRPGGLLYANLDVRPRTEANALFLYEEAASLRRLIARSGFRRVAILDGWMRVYERIDVGSRAHRQEIVRATARESRAAELGRRVQRRIDRGLRAFPARSGRRAASR
ncbi:hypothetical protein GCM10025864_26400 [Luteimicrobium album]|uniref:Methyltransferase type 12 domain-containing protein n=1 Tax=Luteimicrobium album TaxID=1054550 RepID=A0ABQ6I2A6_9MICO|nr:class I SAM-dependent methyltransferase [Luteimicrobium album]GMA24881.1 hypothetical protein GCM10025864_26400 [Luteimicrobium album]